MCIAEGYMLADQRRPRVSRREQYFKTQAEMAQLFADMPEALANSVEIAQRCNLHARAGQEQAAAVSDAGRRERSTNICALQAAQGLAARLAQLYPRRGASAPASGRSTGAPRIRDQDHHADGLLRLLPDRRRFHQLGQERTACRSAPGRGSGAGSLVAYSLGITDLDPLRYDAAVRALPQPRAGVDARLRHRFLPGRPRPRDRVRQAANTAPKSVSQIATFGTMAAQGGGARRRPRARHGLQLLRRAREADPVPAGQALDARSTNGARRWSRALAASARRAKRKCASCSSWPSSSKA